MKKYNIIYADPAWKFGNRLRNGSPEANGTKNIVHRKLSETYNVMTTDEICQLPINDLTHKDCVLFIWTTDAHLEDAMKVINAWGFTYKTCAFTWIKQNPKSNTIFKGVGRWVMGNAELVLLATKGKPKRIAMNISQVVLAKRGRHSQKPEEVRSRIVKLMGNVPKIELFARTKREGWDCWGNQLPKDTQNILSL